MNRITTALATSLVLISAVTGTAFAAVPSITLTADEPGKKLTLNGAKEKVSQWLESVGQRSLRAGDAEFSGNGNVTVTVTDVSGVPHGHVVVHAADYSITDARTGKVLNSRG